MFSLSVVCAGFYFILFLFSHESGFLWLFSDIQFGNWKSIWSLDSFIFSSEDFHSSLSIFSSHWQTINLIPLRELIYPKVDYNPCEHLFTSTSPLLLGYRPSVSVQGLQDAGGQWYQSWTLTCSPGTMSFSKALLNLLRHLFWISTSQQDWNTPNARFTSQISVFPLMLALFLHCLFFFLANAFKQT